MKNSPWFCVQAVLIQDYTLNHQKVHTDKFCVAFFSQGFIFSLTEYYNFSV